MIPLWRPGRLKGREGRAELAAALATLRPPEAAGRLDADRRGWIDMLEQDLAVSAA